MPPTCPFCSHALPASDEPQRFCAFCGQRLSGLAPSEGQPGSSDSLSPAGGDAEPAPAEVGGYRILRQVGSGGMADVYEAEPVGGGPHVAIKVLSGRLRANPVSVERFRRRCALRSVAVWGPIAMLLCASFVVRVRWPGSDLGTALWWVALGLLPAYVAAALVDPERGPHDRLFGTWLVPR